MGASVYSAYLAAPNVSSILTSFVRSLLTLVLVVAVWGRGGGLRRLLGDGRPALWWRGLFGGTGLILSFASIQAVGVADAGFVQSTSAIFVAILAPLVLGQRVPFAIWGLLGIAMVGVVLLLEPRVDDAHVYGRTLALASSLASAVAMTMVARAGMSNRASTVVFYLALVTTLIHLPLLPWAVDRHDGLPTAWQYWAWAGASGILATIAQLLMTSAYQRAPATVVAIAGYSYQVFCVGLSILMFAKYPDAKALLGGLIVIASCLALPWIARRRGHGR